MAEQDEIIEIGIDEKARLYLKPLSKTFPFIYREAMEVHWDEGGNFLYGPKPRGWTYVEWYNQIIKAAKMQSCILVITGETQWVDIPDELQSAIIEQMVV